VKPIHLLFVLVVSGCVDQPNQRFSYPPEQALPGWPDFTLGTKWNVMVVDPEGNTNHYAMTLESTGTALRTDGLWVDSFSIHANHSRFQQGERPSAAGGGTQTFASDWYEPLSYLADGPRNWSRPGDYYVRLAWVQTPDLELPLPRMDAFAYAWLPFWQVPSQRMTVLGEFRLQWQEEQDGSVALRAANRTGEVLIATLRRDANGWPAEIRAMHLSRNETWVVRYSDFRPGTGPPVLLGRGSAPPLDTPSADSQIQVTPVLQGPGILAPQLDVELGRHLPQARLVDKQVLCAYRWFRVWSLFWEAGGRPWDPAGIHGSGHLFTFQEASGGTLAAGSQTILVEARNITGEQRPPPWGESMGALDAGICDPQAQGASLASAVRGWRLVSASEVMDRARGAVGAEPDQLGWMIQHVRGVDTPYWWTGNGCAYDTLGEASSLVFQAQTGLIEFMFLRQPYTNGLGDCEWGQFPPRGDLGRPT
jgi:hypothetical protein